MFTVSLTSRLRSLGRVRSRARAVTSATLLLSGCSLLCVSGAYATPTTFTWSGASGSTSNWSSAANWEGAAVPSGTVNLDFPHLPSPTCESATPTEACYESDENVSGLTAQSLDVEDSDFYELGGGTQLTLGAGGLTSEPATSQPGYAVLFNPIDLGASQTWHLAGTSRSEVAHNLFGIEDELTGAGSALTVAVSKGIGVLIGGSVEVGPLSIEGADPEGEKIANGLVELSHGGALNSVDGEPVDLAHVFFAGAGKLGALQTQATTLAVGSGKAAAGELEAQSVTLDSKTAVEFESHGSSPTPGVDYASLLSSGNVQLGSALLLMVVPKVEKQPCQPPPVGQTYTLVSSQGELTGTFSNAPEGSLIPVTYLESCAAKPAEQLQIEYHRTGAVKTVTAKVIAGYTSTTSLSAAPGSPVTNQNVTLTATVQSSGETPSGSVDFKNGGSSIPGCSAASVVFGSGGWDATCVASFAVSEPPGVLAAVFAPGAGVDMQGSSSNTESFTVGQAGTTTTVQPSAFGPSVNQSVTYTATVVPTYGGPYQPSGTVRFMDAGATIGSCSEQPLGLSGPSASTTCTLSYPAAGQHTITASFAGDVNFVSSLSGAQTITVQEPEEHVQGPALLPTPNIQFPHSEPGSVKLRSGAIAVRSHVALAKLACRGEQRCTGALVFSAREPVAGKGASRPQLVTIGSSSYSIAAGGTVTVAIRLNSAGRRLLARGHGRLAASLKIVEKASGSAVRTVHLADAKS